MIFYDIRFAFRCGFGILSCTYCVFEVLLRMTLNLSVCAVIIVQWPLSATVPCQQQVFLGFLVSRYPGVTISL